MIKEKLHAAKHYFRYLGKASGPHGIHSPFIFDLVNEVLLSDDRYYAFESIEEERKRLLRSDKKIIRTDLGAGSQVSGKELKISSFAKASLCPEHLSRVLFKLSRYVRAKNVLEMGTALGITSAYLALSEVDKVVTLEGDPALLEESVAVWEKLGIQNIVGVPGNFDDILGKVIREHAPFDMVFVDGNHQLEPTLRYVEELKPHLSDQAVVVIDDIYWSQGMTSAWEKLKIDPTFSLTADLYRMGLLFKRPGVEKQDFVLKVRKKN